MELVIKKLVAKNFMRLKDIEVDFPETGVFGILAQGISDPESSNYIGKTSVLEAIRYALTSRCRTKDETKLIHYGEEEMLVEVTLTDLDSNEEFVIRRGRTIKGTGLVEYSDSKKIGEKSAEAESCITDLLGMTPEDFDLTIFFKQAEINQFMSLDPAEKKKMLMKWQDNEHWSKKEMDVLKDIKEKKDEVKRIQVQINNLSNEVGSLDYIQDEYNQALIHRDGLSQSLSLLEKEHIELLSGLVITKEEYKTLMAEQDRLKSRNKDLKEQYEKTEEQKEKLEELKQKENLSLNESEENIFENGRYAIRELENSIKDQQTKLKTLVLTNTGMCPILTEPCDRVKLTPERKKQLEEQIKTDIDKLSTLRKEYEEIKSKKEESNKVEKEIEFLENNIRASLSVPNQIKDIKNQYQKNKERLQKYDPEINEKIIQIKSKLDDERSFLVQAERNLGSLSEKIRKVEENELKSHELRSQLSDINTELDDLTYVAYMFGKNGIPSLEIENSFQLIEDEINYSLSEIDDFEVMFKPDRELKAWEENCLSCGFRYPKGYKKQECKECGEPRRKKRKDELALAVLDKGNETEFDSCSGGLKTLISLSVRTALTMMRKRQNKSNLNILFLDEIDSPLDKTNKDKIMAFITNILHTKYGFKQIFWISHDKNISHNLPNTLLVKGYDKFSKVTWI